MRNQPIGFFDSGVGGLNVLRYAQTVMPEENFIYYGDSLNAPYGTKSKEQVRAFTLSAVDKLMAQDVKALVIACNTATSVVVDELRAKLAIPVISMEPAIKPAVEKTVGRVLLMATSVTLASSRVERLIERFDKTGRVLKVPCPSLAEKIEAAVFNGEVGELNSYVTEILAPYKNIGATAVVLGCTHYPFIKNLIFDNLGTEIQIFDGIDGTVSHLKEILIAQNIKKLDDNKGYVKIESSKKDNAIELYNSLLMGGIL